MRKGLIVTLLVVAACVASVSADVVVLKYNNTNATTRPPAVQALGISNGSNSVMDSLYAYRTDFGTDTPAGAIAGTSEGSPWAAWRCGSTHAIANHDDPVWDEIYNGFTFDYSGTGLELTKLSFDVAMIRAGSTSGAEVYYEVFMRRNAGVTNSISTGTALVLQTGANNVYTNTTFSVDFSSVADLADGDNVEIRIALGTNSGDTGKAVLLQGVQLEAIPEPASLGLILLFAGAFAYRRRMFGKSRRR